MFFPWYLIFSFSTFSTCFWKINSKCFIILYFPIVNFWDVSLIGKLSVASLYSWYWWTELTSGPQGEVSWYFKLFGSASTAIWSVSALQLTHGHCPLYHSFITWLVLLLQQLCSQSFGCQVTNGIISSVLAFLKKFFFLNYFWLCYVFSRFAGFSLVAMSRGYSSLRWAGFSLVASLVTELRLQGTQTSVVAACGLGSCGSRALEHGGSVVVAHWVSCSMACGIFLHQGSSPCLLRWQVDSLPLSHQGSP